ncbi:isocitrate lyase/PEP mutase family protein [Dryocola sp. BD613]|uniref:isocitrate lyase/PEP mutase family protein n=1 Tax=Dryocola sp. BD613 TaxID=3133272 RepID=UPI003F4FE6E2
MTSHEKYKTFCVLHNAGSPLLLVNIWDAGSARIAEQNGAAAIATSSWSLAQAQGYEDGQQLPFRHLLMLVTNICRAVSLPVTVDFEGGYSVIPEEIEANFRALLSSGICGINFEDQNLSAQGSIHSLEIQVERLQLLRRVAQNISRPVFINARTDLFLQQPDTTEHEALLPEALHRARAYTEAGADCIFIPGLTRPNLIQKFCADAPAPVNVMDTSGKINLPLYQRLGVSRVSVGPQPFIRLQKIFQQNITDMLAK